MAIYACLLIHFLKCFSPLIKAVKHDFPCTCVGDLHSSVTSSATQGKGYKKFGFHSLNFFKHSLGSGEIRPHPKREREWTMVRLSKIWVFRKNRLCPYREEMIEAETAFCWGKKMHCICKAGRCLGEKTKLISVWVASWGKPQLTEGGCIEGRVLGTTRRLTGTYVLSGD